MGWTDERIATSQDVALVPTDHQPYRPDIDGLRAVAVLAVVAFHAFPGRIQGGYVGVDVFFVISGFLITGIIASEREAGRFSLRHFYARRIRRIFPSLVTVLTATLVIGFFVLEPSPLAELGGHTATGAAFVPNFADWSEFGYFDAAAGSKPLLHLWSLGIEEQFYITWPLATFLLLKRRRVGLTVVAVLLFASLLASIVVVAHDPTAAFYSPFLRAWELLVGGLLAIATRGRARFLVGLTATVASWVGLVAIVAAVLLLNSSTTFPGGYALLPTVGTALIIAAGGQTKVGRVLSWRPLVFVGLISYPLYLWHWPLLSFGFIDSHGPLDPTTRLGAVALSVVLATATYRWIERPIRYRRSVRWHVPALVAAMAIVGTAGVITVAEDGFVGRYPAALRSVLNYAKYPPADDGRDARCWLRSADTFADFPAECHLTTDGKGLMLWGDSHAGRLYPGLHAVLDPRIDVGELVMDSCPPLINYDQRGQDTCSESNRELIDELGATTPETLVIFAVWGNYSDNWSPQTEIGSAFAATLADVSEIGIPNVIVIGPAPTWDPDLPTVIHSAWDAQSDPKRIPERLDVGLDPVPAAVEADLRPIVERAGMTYVSLLNLLCNDEGCLTSVPGSPGLLLTWDYGHLTTDGAVLVANQLVDKGLIP